MMTKQYFWKYFIESCCYCLVQQSSLFKYFSNIHKIDEKYIKLLGLCEHLKCKWVNPFMPRVQKWCDIVFDMKKGNSFVIKGMNGAMIQFWIFGIHMIL